MASTWEVLRKDARRLETEIDAKLVTYSKLGASLSTASSRTSAFEGARSANGNEDAEAVQRRFGNSVSKDLTAVDHMTSDMENLLAKLQKVVEGMTTSLSVSTSAPSPALAHTIQRHTEILHDYAQEFHKTRETVASARDRAELLSGARSENSLTRNLAGTNGSATDSLYAERTSLASATSGADTAIETGLSLKEDLDRQRAMFASMVERMETMSENMPAVSKLIGQIRRKKKRDILIVAAVVATLLFITFSWKIF